MSFSRKVVSLRFSFVRWRRCVLSFSTFPQKTLDNVLPSSTRSRSLVESRISGTLSTLSVIRKQKLGEDEHSPLFGSIMPYILDEKGRPIFGLHATEQHTLNLNDFPMASLLVFSLTPVEINPAIYPLPRVNLNGKVSRLTQNLAIRKQFLSSHPNSEPYIEKFQFFILQPEEIMFSVPNRKQMIPIEIFDYEKSENVDVLAHSARKILEQMNQNIENLMMFCEEFAQEKVKSAFMYHVDSLGFNLYAIRDKEPNSLDIRLPFPFPMTSSQQCLGALHEFCDYLFQQRIAKKSF